MPRRQVNTTPPHVTPSKVRRTMRKLLALQIALLLGSHLPVVAFAQSPTHAASSAMAPMPLNQALDQFSRSTGLQVVYAPEVADSLRSSAVAAGLDPKQQLSQMLKGTGLSYRFVTPTTVTIVRDTNAGKALAADADASRGLPPINVNDGAHDLAPISVHANAVDTLAPSAAPLDAVQPTSVIDE